MHTEGILSYMLLSWHLGDSSQSHRENPYSPPLPEVVASIALLFLLVDDHSSRWLGTEHVLPQFFSQFDLSFGPFSGLLGKFYIFCLCGPFATWIILDLMAGLGSRTWLNGGAAIHTRWQCRLMYAYIMCGRPINGVFPPFGHMYVYI